jgi:phage terminase large subunit
VLYVYAEHHQRATLIRDHVARIREIDGNWEYLKGDKLTGFSIEDTVCDHDRQERAELEDQGIFSSPAEKTKDIGFQICNRAFKQDRIFISPDCYWLMKELSTNQYKPSSRGGKEEEIDKDNDATAAFRYLVMYFFGHGEIDYSVESS